MGSDLPTFEIEGLMYDVIKEPMDNIVKEPMDSVRKKNNHNCTSTLTHESTGICSNNLENLTNSVINQNDTNSLDSSYKDYLWLNNDNNINLPNNNNSNEFDGFSLESYGQPSCTPLADSSGEYSFSSKPDNYHNKQTDEWQQINNNVNYNTNLNYPYINDEKYNYF